jgi:hypothetical protein
MAQRECHSSEYLRSELQADAALSSKLAGVENFISEQSLSIPSSVNGRTTGSRVIRIPVVVHVLYKDASQNISDAQIQSQIDALNRDFRKLNADTVNIPARFRSLAADIQIEFALASADPNGRATNGIVRKQTQVSEWTVDDKIKFSAQGGDNAWDSRFYMNIWVGNIRRVLGYASAPGGAADKDGLVIAHTAFGTINTSAPYNMGRTAVHETGHWLGLKHIWGDTYCGDDMVEDTPKQGNFTAGCPTGFRSSCSNGTTGDMYMNYMDFTSDACINLFTEGQKSRMRALFNAGGPRASMLESKGLSDPWNATPEAPVKPEEPVAAPATPGMGIYPNPVQTEFTLDFGKTTSWNGRQLMLVNASGVTVRVLTISRSVQRFDISQLKPGVYFLKGSNGKEAVSVKLVKL